MTLLGNGIVDSWGGDNVPYLFYFERGVSAYEPIYLYWYDGWYTPVYHFRHEHLGSLV